MTLKSVDKAIMVLNCFSPETQILGVGEISQSFHFRTEFSAYRPKVEKIRNLGFGDFRGNIEKTRI